MGYRLLQIEDAGAAQIITLHRPERRNALSAEMLDELQTAVTRTTARALIIASNGPVYSSGHDLSELHASSQSECTGIFHLCSRVMLALQNLPVPVIAEVQGMATAAGLQLVVACDLAVAAENAQFATPGVRIGLFCTTPMVPLVRAVGRKRALEMLLTGDLINARTALDWGLVNRVVPLDRLRAESLALANRVAEASPEIIALGKRAFYETVSLPDSAAYSAATTAMIDNLGRADAQEGISAFVQKRRPVWSGS